MRERPPMPRRFHRQRAAGLERAAGHRV